MKAPTPPEWLPMDDTSRITAFREVKAQLELTLIELRGRITVMEAVANATLNSATEALAWNASADLKGAVSAITAKWQTATDRITALTTPAQPQETKP